MKPRNKFEKAVLEQSKHLRPITKTQSKWAFRECIDHFAYRLPKGRTTCMDCGHSWIMNKHRETCTCPHCRAKLQVKETYERKLQLMPIANMRLILPAVQSLKVFHYDNCTLKRWQVCQPHPALGKGRLTEQAEYTK